MTQKKKCKILWADDEIELLKPHIIFLESKAYDVTAVLSGHDAIEKIQEERFDLVFLDENMPGLTGLDTLQRIKEISPLVPVVMVTKSEEEDLMNQALGGKIADYLIKPVNPSQLLLCLKKNLDQKSIISEAKTVNYRQEFSQIGANLNDKLSLDEWKALYRRLIYWELELENGDEQMSELLEIQKEEAGSLFSRFISKNYQSWFREKDERPLMSPDVFKSKVFPLLDQGEKVFFILIDNLRLDQWEAVKPLLSEFFTFDDEDIYTSILPTATHYARNSIFSGLTPLQIANLYPDLWVHEDNEEGKNLNEEALIQSMLERYRKNYKFSYNKVYDTRFGEKLLSNINSLKDFDLNVIVLNFVDMLSHARTESKMIRELANTEAAYRSLTKSWFRHSITYNLFKRIADMGYKLVLTTDHGTIRVKHPIKIIGDKNTNTNLRYKVGRSLSYNQKDVFEVTNPESIALPKLNMTDHYVFCRGRDFFAYPNNYNYYVQYYKESFQHGGISLEEMLIPLITMSPK